MVKNLPSNAGYVGLFSGWGTKIPHAAGQLSPCTTIRETCLPPQRARLLQQRTSTANRKKEKAKKKISAALKKFKGVTDRSCSSYGVKW